MAGGCELRNITVQYQKGDLCREDSCAPDGHTPESLPAGPGENGVQRAHQTRPCPALSPHRQPCPLRRPSPATSAPHNCPAPPLAGLQGCLSSGELSVFLSFSLILPLSLPFVPIALFRCFNSVQQKHRCPHFNTLHSLGNIIV